jgi:hypothetical protein
MGMVVEILFMCAEEPEITLALALILTQLIDLPINLIPHTCFG